MRIVVSGTHASGKSTLISDVILAHPEYRVLADPYEFVDEKLGVGPELFAAQLHVAAERLDELEPGDDVIAERGPLDFAAYLHALDRLGRRGGTGGLLSDAHDVCVRTARHIDLLILLPLPADDSIHIEDDEDPALRAAMDAALLDLADDPDLVPAATFEIVGGRAARLQQLETALRTR